MILGIDIDDTITDTSGTVKKYLKKDYPDYDHYKLLPKREYKRFLKKYIKQMRWEYQLKDGVKEAWQFFLENHFKIIIITARNREFYKDNMKDTVQFLKDHGIVYDKIYFKQKKKGKVAYKEHVDLFIDDKESVLDHVSKYGIECLCIGKSNRYLSFDNWYQIIDYIKEVYHGR